MVRSRSVVLALLLGGLVLASAACSAEGGSDSAAVDASTTTADAGDDPSTTAAGPDPTRAEELEATLPSASDLGAGWTVAEADPSDDDESDDQAFTDQCPELAAAGFDDTDDTDDAVRSFADDDGRQIEVQVGPLDPSDSRDPDVMADAFDGCEVTFEEDGGTTTMRFTAEADERRGDGGVTAKATVTVEADSLPEPVELGLSVRLFVLDGSTGVMITGIDGYSPQTESVAPVDDAMLDDLADLMEQRVGDVVGG